MSTKKNDFESVTTEHIPGSWSYNPKTGEYEAYCLCGQKMSSKINPSLNQSGFDEKKQELLHMQDILTIRKKYSSEVSRPDSEPTFFDAKTESVSHVFEKQLDEKSGMYMEVCQDCGYVKESYSHSFGVEIPENYVHSYRGWTFDINQGVYENVCTECGHIITSEYLNENMQQDTIISHR